MSTCVNHPEASASAFCRSCGRALCEACQVKAQGTIFCEEHQPESKKVEKNAMEATAPNPNPILNAPPERAYPPPVPPYAAPAAPVDSSVNPGLAFLLGLIPGVGAIYNGQYAKGLIHVVVLGMLFSIANNHELNGGFEGLFVLSIFAWFFYMAFEAYHTAKRRMMGLPVEEFSGLMAGRDAKRANFPAGPIALMAVGVVFLLANFDLIRLRDLMRFWPVGLIGMGAYLLYLRVLPAKSE
jgi:hypothetical protein